MNIASAQTTITRPAMDLSHLIAELESRIDKPSGGLPEEVFLFVSRLTPLVNVDLLVRDEEGRTLLTWRQDEYYGPGWHVPGGIIRFKESIADRIAAVAAAQLGASVRFEREPLAMREIVSSKRDTRGHFISLLYQCTLTSPLDAALAAGTGNLANGQWAWHRSCPADLIPAHEVYKPFIGA